MIRRFEGYSLLQVAALRRGAAMSGTYKPALLKAIVRVASSEKQQVITLARLGDEFSQLYWNQTVIFHLRQAATISKEPWVVQRIRAASQTYRTRVFRELPAEARAALARAMAQILTIDVIRRFHKSKLATMPDLFEWRQDGSEIFLPAAALEFIDSNSEILELMANYWWASYLEKVNLMAPLIIEKVQRNGARRGSLRKFYYALLRVGERRCFYCDRALDNEPIEVDHVIPWSFILGDPMWDLVLACKDCNSAKSDLLPQERFLEKLVTVNEERQSQGLSIYHGNPPASPDEIFRLHASARSVEWPGLWSPA